MFIRYKFQRIIEICTSLIKSQTNSRKCSRGVMNYNMHTSIQPVRAFATSEEDRCAGKTFKLQYNNNNHADRTNYTNN